MTLGQGSEVLGRGSRASEERCTSCQRSSRCKDPGVEEGAGSMENEAEAWKEVQEVDRGQTTWDFGGREGGCFRGQRT